MVTTSSEIVLITGANSGVGYGIVERLLNDYLSRSACPPVIIMACRNKAKAMQAKRNLLQKYFTSSSVDNSVAVGEKCLQILIVDLASTKSVFKACNEIMEKYDHLNTLILNAGIIPVKGMNLLLGLKNLITRPGYVARTGGDIIEQNTGIITNEGIGECFSANVFGHWIMVREFETLLERSCGRIIWFSSTTADPMFFDHSDYQCNKGKHPYESSKRLCELLSFYLSDSLSNRGIKSFVCSPGNCMSNITQGNVNQWLMLIALYIMRWFYCSGINILPYNGATSSCFLHETESPQTLDPLKLYHSEITPLGKKWVKSLNVKYEDIHDVVEKMDELILKMKKLNK